jgi:GNAT superfamily N-acetyltransferase
MSAADARERFATATLRHLSSPLADGVSIRQVEPQVWHEVIDAMWDRSLDRPGLDLGPLFTPAQRTAVGDLDALVNDRLEHRLLFEHGGQVIGGYWGQQEIWGRYYMTVSVFHPDWRGRGLYSALLPRVVAAAQDAGFREIYSRHRADNNPILVPKLRAGFVIAGFEVAPRWGLTVHLRRYLVDGLTDAHAYRIDGAGTEALRARGVKL